MVIESKAKRHLFTYYTILYLIFARLDESPFYRANTSANIGLGTRSMSFLNVTVTNEARLLGQEKMAHFCHSLARSSQRRAQITWRVNVLAAGESLIICYLLVVIPIIRINNKSLCIRAKNSGLLQQTFMILIHILEIMGNI